jgi:hypothetical protein
VPLVHIEAAAHIDMQLQKELNLVGEYLIQGKDADVPFMPNLTNKQKKQISKLNFFNTRSKGG